MASLQVELDASRVNHKNREQAVSPHLFPLNEPVIRLITVLLIIFDGLLAAAIFILSYKLRHPSESIFLTGKEIIGSFAFRMPYDFHWNFHPYLSVLYFIPIIQVLLFAHRGLYKVRGEFSFSDDVINIFKALSVGTLLITFIAFFYRGGFEYSDYSYSRLVFLNYYILGLVIFIVNRVGLRSLQTSYRRRHINVIPILIVGSNGIAEMCVREIVGNPRLGRQLIGFITRDGSPVKNASLKEWPVLGSYSDMHKFIRLHSIREVLITDPDLNAELLFDTMVKCGRGTRVAFRVVPNLLNCIPRKTNVEQLGSIPMVRLFEEPLSTYARLLKRSIDLIVSAVILFITAPLWIIIALAIKLESKGSIFYRQERVSMDGHIFLLYKFRSMVEDNLVDQFHKDHMQNMIRNGGTNDKNKVVNCNRLTKVGRIIRRLSLDELPQIFNVFTGEMSLVGPRPPIPYEVECYETWHRKRLDVKPGLTGLWQVSGRYHTTFDQMVKLDIYYIENWSFWLDLKIILKTLPALIMREDI